MDDNLKVANSSLIRTYSYAPDTLTLSVSFNASSSDTWDYKPVSQSTYDTMISARSLGSAFLKLVKANVKGIKQTS